MDETEIKGNSLSIQFIYEKLYCFAIAINLRDGNISIPVALFLSFKYSMPTCCDSLGLYKLSCLFEICLSGKEDYYD